MLLFAARCAMRVEPWMPPGALSLWNVALRRVVEAAFENVLDESSVKSLARDVSDCGARACNELAPTDEALGRCHNYATQTLKRGVEATALDEVKMLKKARETAKFSTSIPAVLAHAGRVGAPDGDDPVELACVTMWDSLRADVVVVAERRFETAPLFDPVQALRDCADLWMGSQPDWAVTDAV